MYKSILFILAVALLIITTTDISNAENKAKKKNYVKIIYFHGEFRCHTCLQIESFIKETIQTRFSKEVKDGLTVLEIINFDEKNNTHYLDKYNLYNQTLIISRYENGKEKEWKSCEDIWKLTGNKVKFMEYVTKEVKDYLKVG